MNIEPLYDRIVIDPIEQDEKTAGGIYIPDSAKEKPVKGKVVAVGVGYRNDEGKILPMKIQVGDVVVYGKWAGSEIQLDGKKVTIMKESDIIAIVK